MLSRRTFLISTAATSLAGCASIVTPVPPGGGGTLPTDFIDQVIALVRTGCGIYTGYAPTVTAIAQVVAAMFGPAALGAISGIAGAVNAVASALCAAAAPAPVAMRFNGRTVHTRRVPGLAQRLARSSPQHPVVIGKIVVGGVPITVTGYQ